jgi:hypothetical protein
MHTPVPPHFHIHAMPPSIVRRVGRGHTSSCRTAGRVGRACSRAHLTSLRPLRHSLGSNDLDDEAQRDIKDAAGSGVRITF